MIIESGVSNYITGVCALRNFFPIDLKGNADVCCRQCRFFSRSTGVCYLTKDIPAYPDRYVGQNCPFEYFEGAEHRTAVIEFKEE